METRARRIGSGGQLEAASLEEFHRRDRSPESCFWIDVVEPMSAELTQLLGPMQLHPLILERCLDPGAASGVLLFEDHLLVQVAFQETWEDLLRRMLSIICLPGAIVTVHSERPPRTERIGQQLPVLFGHHRPGPASIVYVILDRLVDRSVEQTLEIRRRVDELEETVGSQLELDQIGQEILRTKRKATHLELTLEEQHRCLAALLVVESDAFRMEGLRHYFRDVISHAAHSLRYVEAIESRLAEIHQQYLLVLQDRTSSRLKVLTILSAIFMPLSLITGIYGMNFRHMPEVTTPYGYPAVLLGMLALAGALLWFFYRKGWFD